MGPRRLLALPLLLAGCAGAPDPAQPATIGYAGNAAAEVRVNHVEGRPVPASPAPLQVAPGRRTLGLFCRAVDAQGVQREVSAVLAPGGRYRVQVSMEPQPCTLTLIDEGTGKPVGTVR